MLQNLEKISLFHGNSFGGIRKLLITVTPDTIHIKDNSPPDKRDAFPRDITGEENVKSFLEELSKIDFASWEKEYVGKEKNNFDTWSLCFSFSDKEPLEISGGFGGYPKEWNSFLAFLLKYTCVMDFSDEED